MRQLLVFALGDESYGLDVTSVQEIAEDPPHYYVPRAPHYCRGAINFHGTIVSVLDLEALLGFAVAKKDPRVVVLTADHGAIALAVAAVKGIVAVTDECLVPFEQEGQEDFFIREVFSVNGDMVNLLDLERLLTHLETF